MAEPIRLKIKSAEARIQDVRLRMPFRFGIATLTDSPMLTVKVVAEDAAGHVATGYAADILPALWFDKAPGKSIDQKIEDQIAMAEFALEGTVRAGSALITPFDLWLEVYAATKKRAAEAGINELTAGFGSAFAERAVTDAACRLAGISFFEAVKRNRLGIRPGAVHPELEGFDPAAALPDRPLDRVWCRHTVGLADPLRVGDIAPADRVNDGLPQALEEDIDVYGLRYFKIKIDADRERNLERVGAMTEVLNEKCAEPYFSTLDGNEQVGEMADVEWLLARLAEKPAGKRFVDSILFVEQPLYRDRALSAGAREPITAFSRIKPVIIDESDNDVNSLREARATGYSGISAKNCKGVYKSVLNKCLMAKWRESDPGAPSILSSEDLTNIGMIALQQDMATLAALGIDHSERNGHHYFRGLSHLSEPERASALEAHGDLYESKAGTTVMRIAGGRIELGSVQCVGYGYAGKPDFESRLTPADWRAGRSPAG